MTLIRFTELPKQVQALYPAKKFPSNLSAFVRNGRNGECYYVKEGDVLTRYAYKEKVGWVGSEVKQRV